MSELDFLDGSYTILSPRITKNAVLNINDYSIKGHVNQHKYKDTVYKERVVDALTKLKSQDAKIAMVLLRGLDVDVFLEAYQITSKEDRDKFIEDKIKYSLANVQDDEIRSKLSSISRSLNSRYSSYTPILYPLSLFRAIVELNEFLNNTDGLTYGEFKVKYADDLKSKFDDYVVNSYSDRINIILVNLIENFISKNSLRRRSLNKINLFLIGHDDTVKIYDMMTLDDAKFLFSDDSLRDNLNTDYLKKYFASKNGLDNSTSDNRPISLSEQAYLSSGILTYAVSEKHKSLTEYNSVKDLRIPDLLVPVKNNIIMDFDLLSDLMNKASKSRSNTDSYRVLNCLANNKEKFDPVALFALMSVFFKLSKMFFIKGSGSKSLFKVYSSFKDDESLLNALILSSKVFKKMIEEIPSAAINHQYRVTTITESELCRWNSVTDFRNFLVDDSYSFDESSLPFEIIVSIYSKS